jgi:hypothetical protein
VARDDPFRQSFISSQKALNPRGFGGLFISTGARFLPELCLQTHSFPEPLFWQDFLLDNEFAFVAAIYIMSCLSD